jgi:Fur family ferric uptake transcriptional regulator
MRKSNQRSQAALTMIQELGSRATVARVSVLNVLLSSHYALTHGQIEQALGVKDGEIEKVTLYRVLDWLVHQELAHKIVGADRVWRFNAQRHPVPRHAHFNCNDCGKVFCLENLNPVFAVILPQGFRLQKADLSLQGLCPGCSH